MASLLEHVRADARWVVGDDVVLASYSGAADEWTLTPPPAGDESEVLRLCGLVTGAHDARKEELGGA